MGKGKRIKVDADEAVEFTQAELITLLQSTDKKLQTLLSTTDIRFDERLKVILGFVDRSDPLKIRTLFNEDNKIPVQNELIETDLMDLRRKCTNNASNAGNQSVKIEPAANSILLLSFASIVNRDAAGRLGTIYLETADSNLVAFLNYATTVGVGGCLVFPIADAVGVAYLKITEPLVITDAFEVELTLQAVAVSEDADFFMSYSYIGDAPTITETSPVGSTWSNIA